jgi:hypothetical protein
MLDVHAPHEAVHGWRDFFIHLATITIGLLIALGLEGCVEWMHHRNLVKEVEVSLHDEIRHNSQGLSETLEDVRKQQVVLAKDVVVLKEIIRTHKQPEKDSLEINFHIRGFNNVSWQTAQSTGALAYMPYARAQEYSNIYSAQSEIDVAQHQAARDAIISLAPFLNMSDTDPTPTVEEATQIKQHIEVLQGQLMLLNAMVTSLDGEYKKFLTAHPDR